jgi:hypothetical protein
MSRFGFSGASGGSDFSLETSRNKTRVKSIVYEDLLDQNGFIKPGFLSIVNSSLNVYVVATIVARDALTGLVEGDEVSVTENSTKYIYDGGSWIEWIPPNNIFSDSGVTYSALGNKQTLMYDTADSAFHNRRIFPNDVSGIALGTLLNKEVMMYNDVSGNFENKRISTSSLDNITDTLKQDGDILRYSDFNNAYLPIPHVLNSMYDVTISGSQNRHAIVYDSGTTQYINRALTIADIGSIVSTNPVSTQVLKHDGSNYVNALIVPNDIDGISVNAPVAKHALVHNGVNAFVNRALSMDDIITVTTPNNNHVVRYNGSAFVNSFLSIGGISGITITSAVDGQVLTYQSGQWINAAGGGGGSASMATLTDTQFSALTTGDILSYSSSLSKWINSSLIDSRTVFSDNVTSSKLMQFELSGITASTTRTMQIPDANGTIVLNDNAVTLANKTLTSNTTYFADSGTPSKRIQFSLSSLTTTRTITWGDNDLNMGSLMTASSTNNPVTNKTINDATNSIGANILRLSNANPVTIVGGSTGGYGDVFSLDTATKGSFKPINLSNISDAKITDPQNDDTLKMQVTKNIYALGANAATIYRVTSTDLRTSQSNVAMTTGTALLEMAIFGGFIIGVVNTSFVIYRCRVSEATSTNIPLVDIGSTYPGFTYNNFGSSCFASNNSNCIVITGAEIATSIAWAYSLDYGSTWNSPTVLAGSVGSGDFPVIGGNQQYYGLQWSSYYQLFFVAEIKPLPRLWTSPDGRVWSRSVLHVTITGLSNNNPASIAINNTTGYIVITLGTKVLYSPDNITWTASVTTGLTGMAFCAKNNAYYALTGTTIYKSTNGVTWLPIVATTLGASGVFFRGFELTGDCLLMNLSDTNRVIMGDDSILDIGSNLHPNGYFFRNQGVFTLQTNTFINSPKVTSLFSDYSFTLTTLPVNPMTSTEITPATTYAGAVPTTLFSTVMAQSGMFHVSYNLACVISGPLANVNYFTILLNGGRIGRQIHFSNAYAGENFVYYGINVRLTAGQTVSLTVKVVSSGSNCLSIDGINVADGLGSIMTFDKIGN